jgi:hypothetical protein
MVAGDAMTIDANNKEMATKVNDFMRNIKP